MLSFVLSVPLLVEISFSRKDAKSAKGKSIAVLSSWRSLRLGASRFWLRPKAALGHSWFRDRLTAAGLRSVESLRVPVNKQSQLEQEFQV